jgi:hypothetical protein
MRVLQKEELELECCSVNFNFNNILRS